MIINSFFDIFNISEISDLKYWLFFQVTSVLFLFVLSQYAAAAPQNLGSILAEKSLTNIKDPETFEQAENSVLNPEEMSDTKLSDSLIFSPLDTASLWAAHVS